MLSYDDVLPAVAAKAVDSYDSGHQTLADAEAVVEDIVGFDGTSVDQDVKKFARSFVTMDSSHFRNYMAVVADDNLAVVEVAYVAEEDMPVVLDSTYY